MANITYESETKISIKVDIEDALTMILEAARDPVMYAHDIRTIFEKMPVFQYTYFCFYAYDSYMLFEHMLGMNPKNYTSFSLDASDGFFYTLYGGMAGLYSRITADTVEETASKTA